MAQKLSACLVAAATGILAAISTPPTAFAHELACAPRTVIFDGLRKSHGEVLTHRGVTAQGALFEVLVGPEGSFTVFFTLPSGLTCPVATGDGWQDVPPPAAGERS